MACVPQSMPLHVHGKTLVQEFLVQSHNHFVRSSEKEKLSISSGLARLTMVVQECCHVFHYTESQYKNEVNTRVKAGAEKEKLITRLTLVVGFLFIFFSFANRSH